jgi:2-iminobutanoate/2-iminopropanoate deaminase
MVEYSRTFILILIFLTCILAGFCLHGVMFAPSSHPVKQILFTGAAPEPVGPYSQAVRSGDFVFISGQIGLDPATGNLSATTEGQMVRVMENLKAVLQEAGLDFSDVVQTRIYLNDITDWNEVNTIYGRYFTQDYPARATIVVAGLPKGAKVEIEMIAIDTR